MALKFLDSVGVQTLWEAVKTADQNNKLAITDIINGITMNYDHEKKSIIFGCNGKEQTIDATPFINDGMLHDVKVVTASQEGGIAYTDGNTYTGDEKFIKFEWNTDADANPNLEGNQKKVDYILITDMVKPYSGDNDTVEVTPNNIIRVKEVGTDIAKTTANIPVAGGPLADLVKVAYPDGVPAGTSIQDLLMGLICKEMWDVTPSFTEGVVTSTFSSSYPSFTLGNQDTTVEVGTTVSLGTTSLGAATPSISTMRKYSGFKYGYSFADDNSKDSDNTSLEATVVSSAALTGGEYTMKRSYTGFGGLTEENATANTDPSKVTLPSKTLTVQEGTNRVTVAITGPAAQATFGAMDAMYACSNLGNTHSDTQDAIMVEAKTQTDIPSNNASRSSYKQLTGKRYMFWGSNTSVMNMSSDVVRNLDNSQAVAGGTFTIMQKPEGAYQFVVAIPTASGLKLTSAKNATAMNNEEVGKFVKETVQVNGANGYAAAAYDVYKFNSGTGWVGTTAAYTITIA